MDERRPERVAMPHDPPPWVQTGERFFITICCEARHANALCTPARSPAIIEAARTYGDLGRWQLTIFLLMPDHLHMIVSFPPEASMRQTVRAWKAYIARQLGVKWQSGFFDHRLRGDESANEKFRYILANPTRAGLADNAAAWPHCWTPPR